MAAYVISQSPKDSYNMIPMHATPGVRFDFAMSMGVRKGDKDRKAQLDKLIVKNADKIQKIIESYHIPLLPLQK